MNDIIENNMGLVFSIMKRFRPKSVLDKEEYIQAGRIGLWKASKRYDPSIGQFSTYAWPYIQWEIVKVIKWKQKHDNHHEQLSRHNIYAPNQSEGVFSFLPPTLTETEKKVVMLRLDEYSFESIGKQFGGKHRSWASKVFQQASSKIIHANRDKKEANTSS